MGDHQFLRVMRASIVIFAGIVLGFALYSNASIFKMVENAYKITLAGAFVPLFFGAFWKRATTQGALAAIIGGLASWILIEVLVNVSGEGSIGGDYAYALAGAGQLVPPQLIGLGASMLGMVAGSLLPQWVGHPLPHEDIHEALRHRAAAETHHATEHPHHH
jgi:Na+/proline symporter